MRIIRSIQGMRRLVEGWRRRGARIGFVPTMGFLHAGHLSLVKRARREAGPRGKVVVSIYVNPAQFGPHEDFSHYPRDMERDLRLCPAHGVDAVFAPTDEAMYVASPECPHSTCVVEEALSTRMEGVSRPGHFRGVTTIVAKLFNIVQPDLAVFGAKDWQQSAVIRRMVRDLNFPVKILVAPTLREPDGLAMSSRNKYLTGGLRSQAIVLRRSIQRAKTLVRQSKSVSAARLKKRMKNWIGEAPDAELDYVEFFNPQTLFPVSRVQRGTHIALAVRLGKTRLIDNARF